MRVGKETNLNEGNRNRRIAPGLQLAAIDRQRRDPLDTLGPLASLLMIGKLAPKGKHRGNVRARPIYRSQPAVKFDTGTCTRRYIEMRHCNAAVASTLRVSSVERK